VHWLPEECRSPTTEGWHRNLSAAERNPLTQIFASSQADVEGE
jgi:hypothetical protein